MVLDLAPPAFASHRQYRPFSDPGFTGACYRANNWVDVGGTTGFAVRLRGGYVPHG